MIRMVVALPAEARPLANHFGLERYNQLDPLSIYHRPDMALIVSGAGREAAASAVRDLFEYLPTEQQCAWLNVGVAGHRSHAVGTPVLATTVVNHVDGRSYELEPPDLNCETGEIKTVDRIELGFEDDSVYEMEAFGFCAGAKEISEAIPVQVLKIISDNLETGTGYVSARQVQTLIEDCLPLIDRLVYTENRRSRQLTVKTGLIKTEEGPD